MSEADPQPTQDQQGAAAQPQRELVVVGMNGDGSFQFAAPPSDQDPV